MKDYLNNKVYFLYYFHRIYDVLKLLFSELGEKALERILRGAGQTLLVSKYLISLVVTLFSIIIH